MGLFSRERMLAAINCEEPDHVPFVPSFIGPWVDEYWMGRSRMMDMLQMGLDQYVSLDAFYRGWRSIYRVNKET